MSAKSSNKKFRVTIPAFLLAMVIAFAATACGNQGPLSAPDLSDERSGSISEDEAPPSENPSDDAGQDWEAVYQTVLKNEPYIGVQNFFAGSEQYGYVWDFGYYDIDGNGVPELLIALNTVESTLDFGDGGVFIKQIWTVVNGAGVLLIEDFGEGDSEGIYICNDGIIGTQQFSDSASYNFYKIIQGEYLEEIASLFSGFSYDPVTYESGDIGYYYREGQVALSIVDYGTKLTEAEFNEMLDRYGSDPDAQYLTDWLPLPPQGGKGVAPPEFLRVAASSEKAQMGNVSYLADYVQDGDFQTAWCEGVSGPGLGEWIEFSADDLQTVCGFSIVNGYNKYVDAENLYYKNNAVKKLTVITDEFTRSYFLPWDESHRQEIFFEHEIQTATIRFRIDEVYYGSSSGLPDADDEDTLISELRIY